MLVPLPRLLFADAAFGLWIPGSEQKVFGHVIIRFVSPIVVDTTKRCGRAAVTLGNHAKKQEPSCEDRSLLLVTKLMTAADAYLSPRETCAPASNVLLFKPLLRVRIKLCRLAVTHWIRNSSSTMTQRNVPLDRREEEKSPRSSRIRPTID
jgi:hypothetical protein